eukprot:jgi/Hompol1/1146/HPOL_001241-RA
MSGLPWTDGDADEELPDLAIDALEHASMLVTTQLEEGEVSDEPAEQEAFTQATAPAPAPAPASSSHKTLGESIAKSTKAGRSAKRKLEQQEQQRQPKKQSKQRKVQTNNASKPPTRHKQVLPVSSSSEQKGLLEGTKLDKPRASKKQPCSFWTAGKCTAGSECRFSHDGPGSDPRATQICKFFRSGSCALGSTCIYSHDLKKIPCVFHHLKHLGRFCQHGENCVFSHDPMTADQKKMIRSEMNKHGKKAKNMQ